MIKKFFIPFFAFLFLVLLLNNVSASAPTGSLSPSRIDYTGDVGRLYMKTLTVKNTNNFPVNATISATIPNIILSSAKTEIAANSSYFLPFNVTIVNEGYQEGKINVRLKGNGVDYLDLSTAINLYGNIGSGSNSSSNSSSNSTSGNSTDIDSNNSSDSLNNNTYLEGGVLISAGFDSATPSPFAGKDLIINANIKNLGNETTNYVISANGYESYGELLIINPQTMNINVGESKNSIIHLHIKNGVSGNKIINIRADYGEFYQEIPVSINIPDNSQLNITDIAYVVKNTGITDSNFISIINQLGYSYKVIGSSEVSTTNFSKYRMILVGDERISNIPVNNYKSLSANPDYYVGWSSSKGQTTKLDLYNKANDSSITQGLNQDFNSYSSSGNNVYYLTGAKYNANSITTTGPVTSPGDVDLGHFVIATKDSPRRVFFGITKSNYWSDESRQLFKNSIYWVINGEDKDKDGYLGDNDCNDNNASLFRTVKAYLDKDRDGFGTEGLVDVCIGNNLLPGYSFVAGDCNDNNLFVNPGMLEIPYNGVDDDCNGYDLADVDGDGYCKSGYFVQNAFIQCLNDIIGVGSDCNDNDASFNKASEDIYKNCKNDAPLIDNILKIVVYETESVVIDASATDPENSTLIYSINDTRFSKNNSVFSWKTGYSDAGEYVFEVDVSDGNLTNSTDVYVEVKEKNRAPVCTNIPTVSWNENQNASIDLTDYCSDLDGDNVYYELYQVSDNHLHASLGDGKLSLSAENYWFGIGQIKLKLNDGNGETSIETINFIVNNVNQGPDLIENIEEITLYEDRNSINSLDLGYYFFDRDSNIVYNVSGNSNVRIEINNSLVSFYPAPSFVGNETIVFSATDGEFNTTSDNINLKVLYVRKSPKFGEINCTTSLLEENEYSCELNASDAENDEFNFSIAGKNNLDCSVNGTTLNYKGFKDYVGNASCIIRVKDNDGYNDLNFNADIANVNDAPYFSSYSPVLNARIFNDTEKEFKVSVNDIDSSNLSVEWIFENQTVGNGTSYKFKKTIGWYNVLAVVSDGELTTNNLWNVYVGLSNDFTCSEMKGYVCNENQVCNGEHINVYDSSSCCSVACSEKPPVFKEIKRETNITGAINLELIRPSESEEFLTNNKINVEFRVRNDASEKVDYDVFAYIYDNSREDIVEKSSDSFSLSKEDSKITIFSIDIPRKIKEGDVFYVFVKVNGKGKTSDYYNEKYRKIKITRKSDDISIESMEVTPNEALCGDNVAVNVKMKNYGLNSEDVYVRLESPLFGTNTQNPTITIDAYANSDENWNEQLFRLNISDSAKAGEYQIKAYAYYNNLVSTSETSLVLGECRKENLNAKPVVNQNATSVKLSSKVTETNNNDNSKKIIFGLISTTIMLTLFVMVLIMMKIYSASPVIKVKRKIIKSRIKKRR